MEITAEGISVSLGNKKIIDNISTHIKNKQFVGIIGPNGSGKSTFLKCIYRVLKPSVGIIRFDGHDVASMSYRESAKKMAVVAQHSYYNFDFEVFQVVLMGRSPHKKILDRDTEEDYKIAMESLKRVGLQGFEHRNFSTLSGGEQQRVILARAMTQKTNCLVLDEPTNHLDIKYQLQLMEIVKGLEISVLSALHNLNIAAQYCDYLYAFKSGRLVGEGTKEELLTSEFIGKLFDVDVEILKDRDGKSVIVFHSI
ncbi:ABC transporter ATP-binding protein [Anaerovibrio sp.]|uniref:ABC transporter ATP-binding protein n=1 Tax=Anaerovibrio sp. TaxID=1872532 RepID=UPI00388E7CE5